MPYSLCNLSLFCEIKNKNGVQKTSVVIPKVIVGPNFRKTYSDRKYQRGAYPCFTTARKTFQGAFDDLTPHKSLHPTPKIRHHNP